MTREFAGIVTSWTVTSRVRPAGVHRRRWLEAQDLLHRVGDQREVGCQLGPLVRERIEHEGGPTQVARHGLGARAEEQDAEVGQLGVGEPANLAGLVGDLGLDEVGEDVVAWVRAPSAKCSPRCLPRLARAFMEVSFAMPTPSSMWKTSSTMRRSSSCSPSGTPRSEEMTVGGRIAEKSCT